MKKKLFLVRSDLRPYREAPEALLEAIRAAATVTIAFGRDGAGEGARLNEECETSKGPHNDRRSR